MVLIYCELCDRLRRNELDKKNKTIQTTYIVSRHAYMYIYHYKNKNDIRHHILETYIIISYKYIIKDKFLFIYIYLVVYIKQTSRIY